MLQNRVKELRARYGFSQGELGERVGVTRQTIAFIEKGEFSPSVTLALKLAREFALLRRLVKGSEPQKPS